jgi:hypothetical protein
MQSNPGNAKNRCNLAFIFSPIWGAYRISRKPVFMIDVIGNALTQLLFGFSTELWILIAVQVLAGSLSSTTLPKAMANIADGTSERDRGGGMGIIGYKKSMDVCSGDCKMKSCPLPQFTLEPKVTALHFN